MFKHIFYGSICVVMVMVFFIIPLNRDIYTDAKQQPFTIEPLPEVGPEYDLFKTEWWRNPDSIRKVRAYYPYESDAEFLTSLNPQSEAYRFVDEFLNSQSAQHERASSWSPIDEDSAECDWCPHDDGLRSADATAARPAVRQYSGLVGP